MNYIVYVPVKNVLNLYLKIKNLLNKSIWEYAILFKDASAIIVDKKLPTVLVLFNFLGTT